MSIWRIILLSSLCHSTLVHAQQNAPQTQDVSPQQRLKEELAKIPSYQNGLSALATFLPEQAARRFETARATPNLSPEAQIEIAMRIAESNVRAGKGALALSLLKNKDLFQHPQAAYWQAQALAASGQYEKAAEAFSVITPDHPYYGDSLLSSARLNQSLGQIPEATDKLTKAVEINDPNIQHTAFILLAELELSQGQAQTAQNHLQQITDSEDKALLIAKTYLQGQCYLARSQYDLALALFEYLQTTPPFISQRIFHGSALALADTLAASGETEKAALSLTEFIQNHPDSPMLITMLERIAHWIPENPAPDHPIFTQLSEWALPSLLQPQPSNSTNKPTPPLSTFLPGTTILRQDSPPASLGLYEPSSGEEIQFPDLAATSLYHLALITSTQDIAGANSRALILLAYLRAQYPTHILSQRSLLETARIQLAAEQREHSLNTLEILQANVISPRLRQAAAFIQGQLEADSSHWAEARAAFTLASESHDKELSTAATINASSASLREGNLAAFDDRYSQISDQELRTQLELEKALWMHRSSHPEARTALNLFLTQHHDHPRHTDARLALAAAYLETQPIETLLAETELELAQESLNSDWLRYEFTKTKIKLAELQSQWEEAILISESFIKAYPNHPELFNITLRMGEAMMRNGQPNQARQVLAKLTLEAPDHPLNTYALFFNAMAARAENTPQSLIEAIDIFESITESTHHLVEDAVIQQARILIDLDQIERAKSSLEKHYTNAQSPATRHDLGLLLADAYRRPSAETGANFQKAIQIYQELIHQPDLSQYTSNKLHNFLGQTYESIDQLDKALDVYLSVIQQENQITESPQSLEWHWYYNCAFDALSILQEAEQWRSAVAIARQVAQREGPRSKEALALANELSIKHMIWEEDSVSPSP